MSSLGFCNLNEAFNSNNINVGKKRKNSKNSKNKKEPQVLNGMPGTLNGTYIDTSNVAPINIEGTTSTIPASIPISNNEFKSDSEFNNIRKDSILVSGESELNTSGVPNLLNNNNSECYKQIKSLNKEIETLKDLVSNLSNNKNNIIETFANNKPLFKFDNHQFNELLLFIFAGIFIILLFDYIYKLGKKSY